MMHGAFYVEYNLVFEKVIFKKSGGIFIILLRWFRLLIMKWKFLRILAEEIYLQFYELIINSSLIMKRSK